MKKSVILTIALILSLLLILPASAENAPTAAEEGTTVEAIQLDWNQDVIDAFTAAGFSGEIATITLPDGLAFDMLIPEGFERRELTEEEQQLGISLALFNEALGASIRVLDSTLDWANDVSGIAKTLLSHNPDTAIQFAVVNGTTAVISGLPEEDSVNFAFDLGNSRFVQIEFSPLEGNNQLSQFVLASVRF